MLDAEYRECQRQLVSIGEEYNSLLQEEQTLLQQIADKKKRREELRKACKPVSAQFSAVAVVEHNELAVKMRDAYWPAEIARQVLLKDGWPKGCERVSDLPKFTNSEQAKHLVALWQVWGTLSEEWHKLHPPPKGFWWGAHDGWPYLCGPNEVIQGS